MSKMLIKDYIIFQKWMTIEQYISKKDHTDGINKLTEYLINDDYSCWHNKTFQSAKKFTFALDDLIKFYDISAIYERDYEKRQ